jgi:hypothetical protein
MFLQVSLGIPFLCALLQAFNKDCEGLLIVGRPTLPFVDGWVAGCWQPFPLPSLLPPPPSLSLPGSPSLSNHRSPPSLLPVPPSLPLIPLSLCMCVDMQVRACMWDCRGWVGGEREVQHA